MDTATLRRRAARLIGGRAADPERRDLTADAEFEALAERVATFTMTSWERIHGLREAVQYVEREDIPGDFAECGVWRGGSAMVVALTSRTPRRLWLYDTFTGMSEPSAEDGPAARARWEKLQRAGLPWAAASLQDVQANIASTGIDPERVRYVPGKVEETIPGQVPERLSLLRLDTDWYDSTLHELTHLWDRLSTGGVLIIDDYGHWQGARKAVDDFFHRRGTRPLLARLDYTGRLAVKTA